MTVDPIDRFGAQAALYARHRPNYPAELFEFLAGIAPSRAHAWDCGTGNGQAAVALAEHFNAVTATDSSAAQLAHAQPHPRITYRQTAAETADLHGPAVDLITVAQAVHWFELPAFYARVRSVARAGAIIAVWCYKETQIAPEIDALVQHFYTDGVGAWWDPCVRLADDGYLTLPFPFEELSPPELYAQAHWVRSDLLGYLRSWSATQACRRETGADPVAPLAERLAPLWPDSTPPRAVRWRLWLRVGRIAPNSPVQIRAGNEGRERDNGV